MTEMHLYLWNQGSEITYVLEVNRPISKIYDKDERNIRNTLYSMLEKISFPVSHDNTWSDRIRTGSTHFHFYKGHLPAEQRNSLDSLCNELGIGIRKNISPKLAAKYLNARN